jgi:hypothetical protein
MGLLLAILLIVWLVSKAVNDAKLDHTYARQGMVSPRLEAKYGSRDAAQARVAKYGIFDHLRDAWRDSWARRTDAMIAARNARAADGGRTTFRDRIRAARDVVDAPPPPAAAPATTATADPPAVPAQRSADPDPAPPTPGPPADPAPPADPTGPEPSIRFDPDPDEPVDTDPDPTNAAPAPGAADSTSGGTVTTPTGEVVNFETALADLDARIPQVQAQIDAADAALASIAQAKASIETLQTNYEPTAAASANAMDSKAALNLDGTTMGHAGTAVDAMPVGAVNDLYEAMEQVEQETQVRRDQAVTALASLEAEREHLIATYADANDTVAGNLGGDSRFLDGAGGTNGGSANAASQPVAA